MLKGCGSFASSNISGRGMPYIGRGKSLSLHFHYDVLQKVRVILDLSKVPLPPPDPSTYIVWDLAFLFPEIWNLDFNSQWSSQFHSSKGYWYLSIGLILQLYLRVGFYHGVVVIVSVCSKGAFLPHRGKDPVYSAAPSILCFITHFMFLSKYAPFTFSGFH